MRQTWSFHKRHYQRHPDINKIARWAIWHIFLTSLNAPYFASKTEKFAVSASLRSAPSVARGCRWREDSGGKKPKQKPRGDGLEPCDKAQSLRFSPRICDTVAKFAPVRALWARRVERSGAAGERGNKKRDHRWWSLFLLAPPAGLEPATP